MVLCRWRVETNVWFINRVENYSKLRYIDHCKETRVLIKNIIYDSSLQSLAPGFNLSVHIACLCTVCHAQESLFIQKPTHKPTEFLYLDQLMEAWPHAVELYNVNNNKINMCLIVTLRTKNADTRKSECIVKLFLQYS